MKKILLSLLVCIGCIGADSMAMMQSMSALPDVTMFNQQVFDIEYIIANEKRITLRTHVVPLACDLAFELMNIKDFAPNANSKITIVAEYINKLFETYLNKLLECPSRLNSFLNEGSSPTSVDLDGDMPLHYLANFEIHELARLSVLKDILADAATGEHASELLCSRLHTELQDVDWVVQQQGHLWFDAIRNSVEILLQAGADPFVVNGEGDTPLHCAARAGNDFFVNVFVEHNFDVRVKNTCDQTALDVARLAGNRTIEVMLQQAEECKNWEELRYIQD